MWNETFIYIQYPKILYDEPKIVVYSSPFNGFIISR